MYTVRHIPAQRVTDARGLTLHEAFMRLIALSERHYAFTRTGRLMHLLMTNPPPGAVEFASEVANDAVARDEIKEKVCGHGLGQFVVMRDEEYAELLAREERSSNRGVESVAANLTSLSGAARHGPHPQQGPQREVCSGAGAL